MSYSSSSPYFYLALSSSSPLSHTISPYPTLPTSQRRSSMTSLLPTTKTLLTTVGLNASPELYTRPGSQKLFRIGGKPFPRNVAL